jgi:hypothetical protein
MDFKSDIKQPLSINFNSMIKQPLTTKAGALRDFGDSSNSTPHKITRSVQFENNSEINPDQNIRSEAGAPNLHRIEEKYGISNYVKEYEKMKYF